jgi:TolB-like protein/tetratricopeptide (TPR) repeat protein
MADFFAELKRRQIYRVGAAYVVAAWVLTQLIEILAQVFTLPLWIAQAAIVLLAIGFPIALFAAWMIESKPHEAVAAAVRSKPTIVDWTLCGALAVVLLFMGYQQIAPSSDALPQASVKAAKEASLNPRTGISLAVLPFANLSSDPEQEFFSDGMTEEITAALAKVPDLRVVGRTSAFEFKGQNRDLRAIGQALSATHLIEGSVRKAGDRLRITAQLINASDGTHLWSENYDRELTDIFMIQEDIARAIAMSLRMPLGLRPGENLVSSRTVDVDVYQRFLQLRAQVRARNVQPVREQVLPGLEELVAREPNFAPAWSYLSRLYITIQNPLDFQIWNRPVEETRRLWEAAIEKSEKAAREGIRLDPRQAFAYTGLARVEASRKNWAASEDLHRRALDLDPYDPEVLLYYGDLLFLTGRVKDSLRVYQQAQALDPLGQTPTPRLGLALLADGQANAAIALLEGRPNNGGVGNSALAQAYAMVGRFDKASETLLLIGRGGISDRRAMEEAARLIRGAPAKVSDPSALLGWHFYADFAYGYIGATERLLDYPERAMQAGQLLTAVWFARNYATVRDTERFKRLVREAGLVDYWKARGWPALCRPVGNDDFVCE